MSLLTPDMRAYAHQLCIKRDGRPCNICRKEIPDNATKGKKMQIDHRDGDKHNNPADGTNWQRLCPKCNSQKNPRGPVKWPKNRKDIYFQGYRERVNEREKTIVKYEEMAKNIKGEKICREFIMRVMREVDRVRRDDLIDAAAEETSQKGCSLTQQTVKRYKDKLVNPINGPLEEFELETSPGETDYFIRLRPPVDKKEWSFADVFRPAKEKA